MRSQADVVVVGAGHNGLVAALVLARRGLDVLVLEEKEVVGGAARTERPFARVPGLAASTGAYLLGLMPPELLHKLGVEMEIKKVDWARFVQLVEEHQFDATSLRWGNTDVVQDPYEIWHSSQSKDGSNFVFFNDPRVDALIEKARAVLDDARRNELYRKMGRLLYDDAPYTFLYSRPSLDAVKVRVRGIRPSVVWYDLQDTWLAQ